MYKILNFATKEEVNPKHMVFTGGVDNPWEIVMDLEKVKNKLHISSFKNMPPHLSKYLPFMPIKKVPEFISLSEEATPLIESKKLGDLLGVNLYFKVEGKNPTGSFKDRGSAVDIGIAKEMGAKAIILASTGNMAASCACYAAIAKIPCFILVPENVPFAKLAQVIAFGAHIVKVKGTYNDAARMTEELAKSMDFFLAGDYAFRIEGAKTAAFEIIDQLFYQTPDTVIIPMGCGTNISSYAKGFSEYKYMGIIQNMPQLVGVQSNGASSIINSFTKSEKTVEAIPSINTIASAIAVNHPIDGVKALDAIYSTGGTAISVSDLEILEAQYMLSTHEGIFAESSSAASIAALIKLSKNAMYKNKKIVCILTGDGLKDSQIVLKTATRAPTIAPKSSDFTSLYDKKFFEAKSMIFIEKNKKLFSKLPSEDELKKKTKNIFNVVYQQKEITKIRGALDRILKKGKEITLSDLQDSVQDAFSATDQPNKSKNNFSVKAFDVSSSKDKPAKATVLVTVKGKEYNSTSEGTGPVDALISALRKACSNQVHSFELLEYKVDLRGQGSDAVVNVEMRLAQKKSANHTIYSIGEGVSPDIIQASIEAFEDAYNGFEIGD